MKKQIALKFEATSRKSSLTTDGEESIIRKKEAQNENGPSIFDEPTPQLPDSNETSTNIEGTKSATEKNRYRCCWCTRYYSSLRLIRTHECKHMFMCTDCSPSKSFKSKSALGDHLHTNHGVGQFQCNECKFVAASKTYLDKHTNRIHKVESEGQESAENIQIIERTTVNDATNTNNPVIEKVVAGGPGARSMGANNRMILPDGTFLGSASDLPDDVVNVAETMEAGVVGSSDDSIADHSEDVHLRDASVQESLNYEMTEFALSFNTATTPGPALARSSTPTPTNTRSSTPRSSASTVSLTPRKVVSSPPTASTRKRKGMTDTTSNEPSIRTTRGSRKGTSPPQTPVKGSSPSKSPKKRTTDTLENGTNLIETSLNTSLEEDATDNESQLICKYCSRHYIQRKAFEKHEKMCTADPSEKNPLFLSCLPPQKRILATYQRQNHNRSLNESISSVNEQEPPEKRPRSPLPEITSLYKSHQERMKDLLSDLLPSQVANSNKKDRCKKCLRINYKESSMDIHLMKCKGTYLIETKTKCPFCKDPKRYFGNNFMLEQHMKWQHNHESADLKWKKIKKQRQDKLELSKTE